MAYARVRNHHFLHNGNNVVRVGTKGRTMTRNIPVSKCYITNVNHLSNTRIQVSHVHKCQRSWQTIRVSQTWCVTWDIRPNCNVHNCYNVLRPHYVGHHTIHFVHTCTGQRRAITTSQKAVVETDTWYVALDVSFFNVVQKITGVVNEERICHNVLETLRVNTRNVAVIYVMYEIIVHKDTVNIVGKDTHALNWSHVQTNWPMNRNSEVNVSWVTTIKVSQTNNRDRWYIISLNINILSYTSVDHLFCYYNYFVFISNVCYWSVRNVFSKTFHNRLDDCNVDSCWHSVLKQNFSF